jgi:pimeloyl-ACP methyl ester carboxylesterase
MRTRAGVRFGASAILFGVLALAMPSADAARTGARPDFKVSSGTLSVSAAGKLTGRFVVANGGTARAGRSTAVVLVGTGAGRKVAKRIVVPALKPGATRTFTITATPPKGLATGTLALRVCSDANHRQRERSEANNCRWVGTTAPASTRPASGTSTPPTTTAPPPASTWTAPQPVAYAKDKPFTITTAQGGNYWVNVPGSYDATPQTVLLWLHGCGGKSEIDTPIVSKAGSRRFITVAPGGREGDCWAEDDMGSVLAALADVQQHFNVDPRRVVIGGFSSGGDLAYRTAFANAGRFAGVLGVNCQPFPDEGKASIAAAMWKFHVVQLAHTEDEAYNIDAVRRKTDALAAAGFPVQRVERPGHHWDSDLNGVGGTINDYLTYLLVHLDDGWLAP